MHRDDETRRIGPTGPVGRRGTIEVQETLGEFLGGLDELMAALADAVLQEALERVDFYRQEGAVGPEELRATIETNLHYVLRELRGVGGETEGARVAAESGRRRAQQGVPLAEVLGVYRLGTKRLWELMLRTARAHGTAEVVHALVEVAGELFDLSDRLATEVTAAYREAAADMLVSDTRRRAALVETLLAGESAGGSPPWETGKLLGLPIDTDLAVVVAGTAELGREGLHGIERRREAVGSVSAWQLTAHAQRGVLALGDGEHRAAVLGVLREVATTPTGVSPPYRSLRDTPWALHLARTAQSSMSSDGPGVREFSNSPLAAIVAYDPDEGRRLADAVLGRVLALPDEERVGLLTTVETYLACAGSTDRVAETLGCHPNTVRNRLRRVRDLTGRSVDDPRQTAELAAALEAVRFSAPA